MTCNTIINSVTCHAPSALKIQPIRALIVAILRLSSNISPNSNVIVEHHGRIIYHGRQA